MRTVLAVLLLASVAAADIWGEWEARRQVGPHGRYYVVLRYDDRRNSARYALARIGSDAPPAERVEYGGYEKDPGWSVGRGLRESDEVLTTGVLSRLPYRVIVSATGLGFVGVEEWWHLGHGDSVTIVRADGSKLSRRLGDLFKPREIERFSHSASSIWWLRGAWLDDASKKVVLVAATGQNRTVAWDDGEVRDATDADIVRALTLPYDDAKKIALELAAERRVAGAKPAAKRILADETELPAIRLRAAAALAAIGILSGREYVVSLADAEKAAEKDEVAGLAITYLPDVLGEEAIPKLVAARKAGARAAITGLRRLGREAVPALIRLVEEDGDDRAGQALISIGDRRAVPALLKAAKRTDNKWDKGEFYEAAIILSLDEIATELAALHETEENTRRLVVDYFTHIRHPDAVPLLISWDAFEALRFQTGLDLGDDPEAWREWYEKHGK